MNSNNIIKDFNHAIIVFKLIKPNTISLESFVKKYRTTNKTILRKIQNIINTRNKLSTSNLKFDDADFDDPDNYIEFTKSYILIEWIDDLKPQILVIYKFCLPAFGGLVTIHTSYDKIKNQWIDFEIEITKYF